MTRVIVRFIVRCMVARFLLSAAIAAGALLALELSPQLSAQISDPVSKDESRALPEARPTPVTRQEVWQAVTDELRKRGLSEEQLPPLADLDLPVALPALAGHSLRVATACWDEGLRRAQFRLECGRPGQCLPFVVYLDRVHLHHADLYDLRQNDIRDSIPVDACAGPGSRPKATGTRPPPLAAPKVAQTPAPKPVVRPGEAATAVLLGDGLRMTASVTCLDHGRPGEVIRVRGLDGRIFRARVSGPGLLDALPQ